MQLKVIQDSDHLSIGTIEAQVGMRLANSYKISKVNAKSVVAFNNGHTDKFFAPISIYYTEAVRWDFNHPDVDEQAENLAALTRKFTRGESAYQQYMEYGYAPGLIDRIEEAGFDFAEQVQRMRQQAIAQLEKAVQEIQELSLEPSL